MPRSSKHKSHKQSKHSPKEGRDFSYSDSDEEVKTKERERSSKEDSLARVSKDSIHSGSGEKRKHSSQSKEGRDGKDLSGYGNGDASEEYVSSKRRKEKGEAGSGADRWNGAADSAMKGESLKIDADKGSKGKETKSSSDSKSKSSKKEGSFGSLVEKEESKSGRVDSKRKSEKDSGRKEGKDSKEVKEKERGSEREKKGHESKRDDVDNVKKQVSQSGDVSDEKQNKKGRETAEWSIPNEVPSVDLDKDAERRARKRREVPGDRDKYDDDINESDDRRLSSRYERTKDEKQRHEKHKEYKEDGDKDDRHKDDRYREDVEKDRKRRDDKYREDSDRDNRRRDDRYLEDVDRDSRRRDDKYRDDGDRDNRRKDDRYREDDERDGRRRDDKYREDGDNDNRHGDDKYREYGEKDGRHDEDRYHEDGERDDRQREIKYREDGERDKRRKDEKHRDDFERHGRYRDGSEADESDKKRRLNDAKYGDERAPRDHSGDRSDAKRSRDEGHASDLHLRKSGMHEGNPGYDRARYKDEPGRRRTLDKEDLGDIRSRSSKDQRSEAEKRSISSARVESVSDRGRSSRNADAELTPKKSRWKTSPTAGTHSTRDNYRLSKQEESKYRDYSYEERIRHGGTSRDYAGSGAIERISSSRSTEKMIQKEDLFLGDFSAERRLKSDVRSSPLQLVDRSPTSASNERRHSTRSEVRRSLDVEDSTQRSGGGSREVKEGRGNRDFAGDAFAGDELSQMDGDNVSVSSPFIRGSHLSGISKSTLPPPPPFRSGVDNPSMFGSLEDDSRGKTTNRHRRINDPNIGRMQGNAWKGVPNWPSPLANGFMPFQHGPPPVGFHPAMQQFPGPPMFGVRPSMELSHPGVPYHMPDADRFSGHGRPMGWRTPLDDSCGPPLHGWDANNFGEDAHLYGRPDWDQNRTLPNNSRSWETIGDVWKGPIRGTSVELPSGSQNEVCSIQGPDNSFAAQLAQQALGEQKQTDQDAESKDISFQPSSIPGRSTVGDLKINHEEQPIDVKSSGKEAARLCNVYLKKLDISAALTEPELFDRCASLMDVEQIFTSDNSKIMFLEGAVESNATVPSKFSSVPLISTVADSVFQKAISLYKKRREENTFTNGGNRTFSGQLGVSCPAPELENPSSVYAKLEGSALMSDGLAEDGDEGVDVSAMSEEVVGLSQTTLHELCEPMGLGPIEKLGLPTTMDEGAVPIEKSGLPTTMDEGAVPIEKSDLPNTMDDGAVRTEKSDLPTTMDQVTIHEVEIGRGAAVRTEKSDPPTTMDEAAVPSEKSDLPTAMDEGVGMEADTVVDVAQESKIAEKSLSLEEVGQSDALAPLVSKDLMGADISVLDDVKEEKSVDAKCGPLPHTDVSTEVFEAVMPESIESEFPHTDVSTEVFEAVMPESIESESLNLSRIHHSPESTH